VSVVDRNKNGAGTGVATGDACTELVGQAPDGQDPDGQFVAARATEAQMSKAKNTGATTRIMIVIDR